MAIVEPVLQVPEFGVIKGGTLDGWRYHFLNVRVRAIQLADGDVRHTFQVVARCTPPHWPFPCDIRLTHEHFRQLRPVPRERPRRINIVPLVRQAFELKKIEPPAWLKEPRKTVRALMTQPGIPAKRKEL